MRASLLAMATFPGAAAAPAYALWNVADKSASIEVSNGGRTFDGGFNGTAFRSVRATVFKSSGKWKSESVVTAPGAMNEDFLLGVATAAANLSTYIGASDGAAYYGKGFVFPGGAYGPYVGKGDRVTTLLNLDDMELRFKVNGTLYPVIDISFLAGPVGFAGTAYKDADVFSVTTNFGQDTFIDNDPDYLGMSS